MLFDVFFRATVVQAYATFWTNIESAELEDSNSAATVSVRQTTSGGYNAYGRLTSALRRQP